MQRRHFLAASALPLLAGRVLAADSALRILVGAPPGGGTDLVARAAAQELSGRLHRTITVENRPGAAGNIAAAQVAKDPDALLLCYTSHVINPSLFASLPFDPIKDFTPLSLVARSPLLLVARPDFPASTFPELQALAKKRSVSIGIAGIGSANHLASEMLRKQGGMELLSVSYKGAVPALTDAMGGQIDLVLSNVASAQTFVAARKLKVLAVSTAQRVAAYPDAAPIADVLPGFDYSSWYGLLGAAGMKPQDVEAIGAATALAVRSEAMRRHLQSEGLEPVGSTPAEFARFLQQEVERWRKVVALTGTKVA
ncbi:tripartite tricarboxylate transporter substrate binding protein [Ramlibacter ginsenosidimutans]|uniref:Tripartite tricarboxylate transporter substrate binding protein n=1 Tax=Ramlibacter ginsenosidimutans TaxID=502333 RepID=A0A934TTS0_9BURK|nr:tripartite tricarboxylate transporter substrate-binding protein [Ramlibacter ginsenosidimutans]MBK6007223.1 tripartite tricarboxylate transporter substrate binding protein [Ramlibacter ginsenosidimutans]